MPATTADLGHIPAPLLARLPAAREALPPQAQGAIDRHFEQCAACSEELALLVHLRAHAPQTPGWEAMGGPGRRRGASLWLGGYAVLATAAAVVLALRGPLSTRPTAPTESPAPTPPAGAPAPDRPAAGAVPAPLEPRATALPAGPAWSIRLVPRTPRALVPLTRDAVERGTIVRRSTDPGALLVRVEPLLPIADGDLVAIELLDRNERLLATATARWRDLHGGREILLTTGSGALPAGSYVLRVRAAGPGHAGGAADSVDHPFEIAAER